MSLLHSIIRCGLDLNSSNQRLCNMIVRKWSITFIFRFYIYEPYLFIYLSEAHLHIIFCFAFCSYTYHCFRPPEIKLDLYAPKTTQQCLLLLWGQKIAWKARWSGRSWHWIDWILIYSGECSLIMSVVPHAAPNLTPSILETPSVWSIVIRVIFYW